MKLKKLTHQINDILELFIDLCPNWKFSIYSQINASTFRIIDNYSTITVYFDIDRRSVPVSTQLEMPIEIILGEEVTFPVDVLSFENKYKVVMPGCFYINDKETVAVRLYFDKGYIKELEIYSICNTKVNVQLALSKPITYIVHEKQLFMTLQENTGESTGDGYGHRGRLVLKSDKKKGKKAQEKDPPRKQEKKK